MRGQGTSTGHSQPRTCSGRNTLKRCKNNGETDNIVLIDVDSDNVIIIDVPDSLSQKVRGSSVLRKDKKCSSSNIICIDDDECTDNNHPGRGAKFNGNFFSDNDASSSTRSCPASNHSQKSVDAVVDECLVQETISRMKLSKCKRTYHGKTSNHAQKSLDAVGDECHVQDNISRLKLSKCKRTYCGKFSDHSKKSFDAFVDECQVENISPMKLSKCKRTYHGKTSDQSKKSFDAFVDECQVENISPMKLSKCKRTYSGKTSFRNRYGLSPDSVSSSSDNDFPDCEFMEDSFGKLQEQWEKASLKRKYDVHNGQSVMKDQASASRFCTDTHQNVGVENKTERHPEAPVCSTSSKASHEKEDQSPFIATGDCNQGSTFCNPEKTPFADTDFNSMQKTQFSHSKADVQDRRESFTEDPSCNPAEGQTHTPFEHGGSSFHNEERIPRGPSLVQEQCNEQVNNAKCIFQDKEKASSAEPYLSNSGPGGDINFCHSNASLLDEEASLCRGQHSVETKADHGDFRHEVEKFQKTPSSCNSHFSNEPKHGISLKEKEKSVCREPALWNTQPSVETQVSHGVDSSNDKVGAVPEETFYCKSPSSGKSGIRVEKGCHQEDGEPAAKEPSFLNICLNEAQQGKSCLLEVKEICVQSMSSCQQEDKRDNLLHAQHGEVVPAIQSCIINEREKLKETDEYKRAIEEEWASRQRELQIQAEEAQHLRRLRKRRKAENLRLVDMERRQKQRVEEMRETQKKDEENLNLKELLRAEVRKELSKLEITCHDMASLLRGLGIHVSGGLHPLPNEVRAAYKRALLSFHPDRASTSDVRHQVDAEEKFKLISRMKEKFLSNS